MFRLADVNVSRADDNCLEKKQKFQQYHKNRSRSIGIYIDWGIEVTAYTKDKQTLFQQFLYTWLFYPHVFLSVLFLFLLFCFFLPMLLLSYDTFKLFCPVLVLFLFKLIKKTNCPFQAHWEWRWEMWKQNGSNYFPVYSAYLKHC